ncbi:SHOCT domain-containing protein [Lactobacillus sp. ESL0791]|uniref:SHOCT domain-containing protein n=1 Tax=Lactobacillus sp. ESL0791 TaxID=2983234 RepID=UPI0023F854EE|nr:SHOCT domain-containing protein [Lactobacillus sp. ESL0791]MDF7639209.1 SHOCT domain-containing protein [Lactobacillus sp. ESL0791]
MARKTEKSNKNENKNRANVATKKRKKKSHKPWYKRFWVWLLIITIFQIYLFDTSTNIFIKIIVSLCAVFGIWGICRSDKKNNATCALCGQSLKHSEHYLKFKKSAYICEDCLAKYNFTISPSNAHTWAAHHTIADFKNYLDQDKDFSDIKSEIERQNQKTKDTNKDKGDIVVSTKKHNKKPHKPWYKRFWVWLLIGIVFLIYLSDKSTNIFLKIIISLCSVFGIWVAYTSSKEDNERIEKKNRAFCVFCCQSLKHSEHYLIFKDSVYVCESCMAKYNFTKSTDDAQIWAANHTIADFNEYLDQGKDFTDIELEMEQQRQIQKAKEEKEKQQIEDFKKNSVRYSHYYFNIAARKIYIRKTFLEDARFVDASEIVSYDLNEKDHVKNKHHVFTRAIVGALIAGTPGAIIAGVTGGKEKGYLDHFGLVITLIDGSKFEIKFLTIPTEMTESLMDSLISKAKAVASIIDNWKAQEEEENNQNIAIDDVIPEEIRKYKQLADDNIITQEEFEAKKKELLNL